MYNHKKLLGITGAVLLSMSMNLSASEDITDAVTESGKKTQSQAKLSAKELVKKSYNYLGSLKSYAYNATIVNEDEYADHMMLYITHNYDVTVQRPDKVRIEVRGDVENRNTVMNNGKVSIYELEDNIYSEIPVEDDIDDALDTLIDDYNLSIPLTQLLYSDTAVDIEDDLESDGYYFGTVDVEGTPCYYIGFPGKEWDIQLWIEKGDKPLIRRAAFVDKMMKNQPRSMITVSWELEEITDKSLFTFTPPKDAKKVEIKKVEIKKIETKDQK